MQETLRAPQNTVQSYKLYVRKKKLSHIKFVKSVKYYVFLKKMKNDE